MRFGDSGTLKTDDDGVEAQWSTPTMTLEALTMAETESPVVSPKDLTVSFVMVETTSAPLVSFTVTSLFTAPS